MADVAAIWCFVTAASLCSESTRLPGISWCHQHAVTNACVHVLLALLGQAARQRALYARATLMPKDVEVQGGRQPELITN